MTNADIEAFQGIGVVLIGAILMRIVIHLATRSTMTADPINCMDACGRAVPDQDAAAAAGWLRMQITGRYRCPACARALAAINVSRPAP